MAIITKNKVNDTDTYRRDWSNSEEQATHGDDSLCGEWVPTVDIFENDNRVLVNVALPGVSQDKVDVTVDHNVLTIAGERALPNGDTGEASRLELCYGKFSRSFTLPNTIAQDQIEANMDRGILALTLPKREEAKPKSIKVNVS